MASVPLIDRGSSVRPELALRVRLSRISFRRGELTSRLIRPSDFGITPTDSLCQSEPAHLDEDARRLRTATSNLHLQMGPSVVSDLARFTLT